MAEHRPSSTTPRPVSTPRHRAPTDPGESSLDVPANGAAGGRPVACPSLFWNTLPADQGQIVSVCYAQVSGAAEGESGPADGLSLCVDASDRTWVLTLRGVESARGRGDAPSPERALHLTGVRSGIYRAYDRLTEWSGPVSTTVGDAQADAERHNAGCSSQGGYGSARVALRDGDRLQDLNGATIWPPHGRGCGAARWR